MNCFDCGHRRQGKFPHEQGWTCELEDVKNYLFRVNKADVLKIEQLKVGCHKHWIPKPHPTQEDWSDLAELLVKYPSRKARTLALFKAKFYVGRSRHAKKHKSQQVEMTFDNS